MNKEAREMIKQGLAQGLAERGILPSEFEAMLQKAAWTDPISFLSNTFGNVVQTGKNVTDTVKSLALLLGTPVVAAGLGTGYLLGKADKPTAADVGAAREEDLIQAYYDEIERVKARQATPR